VTVLGYFITHSEKGPHERRYLRVAMPYVTSVQAFSGRRVAATSASQYCQRSPLSAFPLIRIVAEAAQPSTGALTVRHTSSRYGDFYGLKSVRQRLPDFPSDACSAVDAERLLTPVLRARRATRCTGVYRLHLGTRVPFFPSNVTVRPKPKNRGLPLQCWHLVYAE